MRGGVSFFDKITKKDLILAFFPCTRFETRVPLLSRGEAYQQKNWEDSKKLEYSRKIVDELNKNYQLLCKLFLVCIRRELKLVVENPSTQPHFLNQYFPIKPKIVHKDRSLYGDYYKKPTQYWFYNTEPRMNFFLANDAVVPTKIIEKTHNQVERSLISPRYANRFIREYLISERG